MCIIWRRQSSATVVTSRPPVLRSICFVPDTPTPSNFHILGKDKKAGPGVLSFIIHCNLSQKQDMRSSEFLLSLSAHPHTIAISIPRESRCTSKAAERLEFSFTCPSCERERCRHQAQAGRLQTSALILRKSQD